MSTSIPKHSFVERPSQKLPSCITSNQLLSIQGIHLLSGFLAPKAIQLPPRAFTNMLITAKPVSVDRMTRARVHRG